MRSTEHAKFWAMYESQARPALERACRHASRTLTDSTMDIDDMVAWIDTKVWRMLESDGSPTFHDDPSPKIAIERILTHASTLARWSYLALCRKHFRRINNRSAYLNSFSRTQQLSMTSAVDTKIEHRNKLDESLNTLREQLTPNEKQRLAASWIDKNDRQRVAMVLGATRKEDDRMITKATGGGMKENAVQQMRSRARKRAAEILNKASNLSVIALVGMVMMVLASTSSMTEAGEQTGGRKGGKMTASVDSSPIIPGEQTGGRRPKK